MAGKMSPRRVFKGENKGGAGGFHYPQVEGRDNYLTTPKKQRPKRRRGLRRG